MMYGKLVNGELVLAPKNYNNILNFNQSAEKMLACGYKPITDCADPEFNQETEVISIAYQENSNNIEVLKSVVLIGVEVLLQASIAQKIQNIQEMVGQTPDIYQAAFIGQIQFGINLLTSSPSEASVARVIALINDYPIVGFSGEQMNEINAIKQQLVNILSEGA